MHEIKKKRNRIRPEQVSLENLRYFPIFSPTHNEWRICLFIYVTRIYRTNMLKIYAYAILISAYFFFSILSPSMENQLQWILQTWALLRQTKKCNCYKVFKEYQLEIYCSQLWFHLEYLNCILLSLLEICRGLYALAIIKSTNFQQRNIRNSLR